MIYVTGDTHGDFGRFATKRWPQQKTLSRDDYVIVCGDFGGVWDYTGESKEEKYNLDWLASKPFTILFVDGNHENFDRLSSYPRVKYHGGCAHKIRHNIYHLMRGYVFDFDGKRIFTFGGAASHDIRDGIIDPKRYSSIVQAIKAWQLLSYTGYMMRIKGISWWERELPTKNELQRGISNLEKCDYNVDYIISHSLPLCMEQLLYHDCKPNKLTSYFDGILEHGISFHRWYCGHYHQNRQLNDRFTILYKNIVPLGEAAHEST